MGVCFLGEAQRPWARFSETPACRHVRRSSRLRSGSPPCGGVRRSSSSCESGHLRASRRPAWWPWRSSPGGHSRGSPTRHCAHQNSNAGGTIPCTARPPLREFSCSVASGPLARSAHPNTSPLGGVGFQPAQRPRAFGAAAPRRARCPSHHGLGPTGAVPVVSPVAFLGLTLRAAFSATTGSATRVAENQPQRQGQDQGQRQRAASGTGAATVPGHGPRSPGSGTDRGVAGHLVLRCTGLRSRSALIAPPLRLAALRWRAATVILGRLRPPPGVSTAFLVAVARFSERPFPGEPHTVLCPSKLERNRHNTVYGTPVGARVLVPRGALDSRVGIAGHLPTGCGNWLDRGSTLEADSF
jgi:hypothetical protein